MNPLSWERSYSSYENETSSNHHKSNHHKSTYRTSSKSSRANKGTRSSVQPKLDLLTFGYGCKLFNDEEQARYIEQGKNLIPIDGDNNLLIDRFDVRSYLNAIDLQKYEAKMDVNYCDLLVGDEIEFEQNLDVERYRDLLTIENRLNIGDHANDHHEDELKRLKESIEDDKKYNQIEFDYNSLIEQQVCTTETRQTLTRHTQQYSQAPDIKFVLPNGLNPPDNIQQPSTMKEHNLIAKTAKFISKQGVQMEILLKTKQSSNSQFDFLSYDSPLNPYYKYLVKSIKDGHYKPIEDDENGSQSSSNLNHQTTDEESDDGGYLHPSLLSSNRPSYSLSINRPPSKSLYSKLAENLKDKIVVNDRTLEPKIIESKPVRYSTSNRPDDGVNRSSTEQVNSEKESKAVKSVFDLMPEVPGELKLIIEKLAQYVAKNGDEFEKQVKSRNESRFEFLNPGHKFHFYYVKTKLKFVGEKRKQEKRSDKSPNRSKQVELQVKRSRNQTNSPTRPVEVVHSAHENSPINDSNDSGNKSIQPFMISTKKSSTSFKDDLEAKQLKEKQEERKRKAALFLDKLKVQKSTAESSPSIEKENSQIIGPQLPDEQRKESLRNTPSPLKELFDELDFKSEKGRKQLFDDLDNNGELKTPETFKATTRVTRQFRVRDDSSSDESVSIKRSLSRGSNHSPDRRSRRSRSRSHRRSRSRRSKGRRSTSRHSSSRRNSYRSRSRDRRSREHHRRDRSREKKDDKRRGKSKERRSRKS